MFIKPTVNLKLRKYDTLLSIADGLCVCVACLSSWETTAGSCRQVGRSADSLLPVRGRHHRQSALHLRDIPLLQHAVPQSPPEPPQEYIIANPFCNNLPPPFTKIYRFQFWRLYVFFYLFVLHLLPWLFHSTRWVSHIPKHFWRKGLMRNPVKVTVRRSISLHTLW